MSNSSQALQKAEQKDPMKDLIKAEGEDPSKVEPTEEPAEQSDIICFNGFATLVPKRAILAIPAKHKDWHDVQPGSRIVGWSDFYAANRGWITTVEVSRVQAEGNLAIAEETQDRISKSIESHRGHLHGRPYLGASTQGAGADLLKPQKPHHENLHSFAFFVLAWPSIGTAFGQADDYLHQLRPSGPAADRRPLGCVRRLRG